MWARVVAVYVMRVVLWVFCAVCRRGALSVVNPRNALFRFWGLNANGDVLYHEYGGVILGGILVNDGPVYA